MCQKCNTQICTCEREVISPIGRKGEKGPAGPRATSLPAWWFKGVMVDFLHGDDAKAVKYSNTIPYKTFAAARLAAVAGDTIVFLPGTHDIYNGTLAMNGVSVYAMPGSVINVHNDQTVTQSEGLTVLGEGIWIFNNTGITLAGEHSNTDTYTFNFKELHIKGNWGLKFTYGNISINGVSVYIEDYGTTFYELANWEGTKAFVRIDNLFDYSDYNIEKDGVNIRVHSVVPSATHYLSFGKIFTYNSRCMILTNTTNEFNCSVHGDIDQFIQTEGASPNCTIYMTGNGANYKLYGGYRTNCNQCLVVTSAPTNSYPIKVYHQGSIYSDQVYGCVIVAGLKAYFKMRGIYIGGIYDVPGSSSESAIIKTGIYNDYNFMLPDGVTTGGNVEINGTIVNRQDVDSNEIFAVYDFSDTENTFKLRIVNSKFVFPNTNVEAAIKSEIGQSLEVVGSLSTNATILGGLFTKIGAGVVDIAAYTDDLILE